MRWSLKVRQRDNDTCQICGGFGTDAHHIRSTGYYPDLSNDPDNGVTLCRFCHLHVHRGRFGAHSIGKEPADKAERILTARAKGNPAKIALIQELISADMETV